jgi:hypothetical protein
MFRLIGALLASFALLASSVSAADSEYQDPQGRFAVGVPADWIALKVESPQIAVVMMGMKDKDLVGICAVSITKVPDTKSTPQSEIDEGLDQVFTPAFWKMSFQASGASDVVIESTSVREQGGRKVYTVVVTMSEKTKEGPKPIKSKEEVHGTPGAMHVIACATAPDKYDTALADFDAIFNSYRPMQGLISEAPSAGRSVMTLYAKPNFEGAARVLSHDVPDFAALGLSAPPASVAVAGFGRWEACEGANFTGACRALSAMETAARGQALRLGSVRRIQGNDPRGMAGVASTAAGITLKGAAERVVQER